MKRNILISATAIICMALVSCDLSGESFGGETINGDGNLATRTYDVGSFDYLAVFLPFTNNYAVNVTIADAYTCTVRVDENLFEYLDIKVKDDELQLGKPQKRMKFKLRPTACVIDITAPSLEEVNMGGCGTINMLSPLNTKKMEFFVAGSGNIVFKEVANIAHLELGIAGSGDILIPELVSDHLEIDIAGSGNAKIERGNVTKAEVDIAGSGDCDLVCQVETLEADIAGSGDITARVSGKLEYSIIGSGDIGYYGNPVLKGDKLGHGTVSRLGD